MKKSLIAMAVFAASGAAMAQSSVQLYGLMDIWTGSVKTSGALAPVVGSTTLVNPSGFATSRFGFKGSEDLGGGLKANFQLEQGFNNDTGTTQAANTAFNRQSWVGLSGGFGEVQIGRVWTSYDDIRSSANDTFGANVAASFNTWVGYNDRTSNGIKYISPAFGGFSGSFTYALGEDKLTSTNGKSNDMYAVGLQYADGPLFVGFSHQTEKEGFVTQLAAFPGVLADGSKGSYNLVNASYDFGAFKLVGGINQVKFTDPTAPGFLKASEYNLGVEVPLAQNLVLAGGYAQSKLKTDVADVGKTKGYALALQYSLSKRTSVYGVWTNTKSTVAGLAGDSKTNLYAVGLQHKF